MKKQFIFFLIIIMVIIFIFSIYKIIQKQSLMSSDERNYPNQTDITDNSSLDSLNITSPDKEKQFMPTAQDIIGAWYIISSNPDPKYKNKVITDYTKFTFYPNGKVDRRSFISDEYKIDTGKYIFSENDNTFPITFSSNDIEKSDSFWKLTENDLAQSYYKDKKDSLYVKENSIEWNEREKTTVTTNIPTAFIDSNNLEIGKIYELSKKTPLMPELSPVDPIAALSDMKELGAGSTVKIISSVQKNNTPWYNVSFINYSTGQTEYGWINSTALIGQSLKEK
ncbi:hypothetical protein COT82_00310 [Candidatus Campbellbacteria bacterium CG10_big_fil_rev_8_21_14_0_10_35_52]|uniref:Uncharacterized protein n=1 Tax=Candidatus Campbellbacteria bacterium CG10_big_fil_rev_8_21_14_0_10_35_52 TaxID=1974527 RepID=A0A2M6WW16_9BACT|nr:MAG: hypothetical protein COT82_00310 [Candidatus Campbellbacteria bacterium CG10_big_fil_rev_8_21_14_0_10_35_52]